MVKLIKQPNSGLFWTLRSLENRVRVGQKVSGVKLKMFHAVFRKTYERGSTGFEQRSQAFRLRERVVLAINAKIDMRVW